MQGRFVFARESWRDRRRGVANGAGSGFAAESAFHNGEEKFALGVGVGSGLWLGFGEGFGGLVFALFEDESGTAEASERVECADEVDGIGDELILTQGFEDLGEGELVCGLMELDDVVVLDEIGGIFAEEASFGDAVLVLEVKLIAALEPVGDVFAVE